MDDAQAGPARRGELTRRAALGGALAGGAALAMPAVARAQAKPIRIGLLSDVAGPYRNVGGPAGKVATDLAVEDFGGTLLGRPIEVMQVDVQNKPDIASSIARQWVDGGVDVLMDGAATPSGLAIQEVSRAKKVIFLANGPSSAEMTGKYCSPYAFHFWANSYSLAKGPGVELTQKGEKTWYFITADYQFGYSLQESLSGFVRAAGGQVLGAVRTPLGTTDFSSALLQARTSGAKVVALAIAGSDLQNCIKQASEFGIAKGGQTLATLVMFVTDVALLGQDVCQGLVLANSFYWDATPETRVWTARFAKRMDLPPTQLQAANYSAALHWMRAVKATGTLDADRVTEQMRATPVSDACCPHARIEANGQALVPMGVWRVKPASQATHKWDFYEKVGEISGADSFPPLAQSGCPLVGRAG